LSYVHEPARDLPVLAQADVVVAGGGPAGLCAALAAARNGATTVLLERQGFAGGMATAGALPCLGGFHGQGRQVTFGIPAEIIERLIARGAAAWPARRAWESRSGTLTFVDHWELRLLADEMLREAGVEVFFDCWVAGAHLQGDRLTAVLVETKAGRRAVTCRAAVDATGDGDLAASAGAPFEIGRPQDGACQPPTLIFHLTEVDPEAIARGRPQEQDLIARAREAGDLELHREDVLMFPGHGGIIIVNSSRVPGVNCVDPADLTRAEMEARRLSGSVLHFLRAYWPGFARARLAQVASVLGVRETRRILGDYILTEDDVLQVTDFPDTIARAFWYVDVHDPHGPGTVWRYHEPGATTDVPYRCLLPRGVEGLLVAGRPISTTHEAHGSTRIMSCCAATGQAAGTAAAMAAGAGATPRQVPAADLVSRLNAQGANLDLTAA